MLCLLEEKFANFDQVDHLRPHVQSTNRANQPAVWFKNKTSIQNSFEKHDSTTILNK